MPTRTTFSAGDINTAMCGICGYIDRNGNITPDVIHQMNQLLHHRGPDGDGVLHFEQGAVAMRRLKIVDISGGDQPIYNEDKTLAIMFNGEIYNYPPLRDDLLQKGHVFTTKTDTEAILHAYESYGVDCLEHLNGMFAFCIIDLRANSIFVARDRTGIKPLYFAEYEGGLVFASELKALLKFPGLSLEIDHEALDQYLTFEYIPAPRSIFRSIRKLEPGHAFTYDAENGFRKWRYWDMNLEASEGAPAYAGINEAAEDLRECLREVVKMELMSDVPLGLFLSGGVDSSSIAAMLQQIGNRQMKSFSITFEDSSFNESHFAHMAAQHTQTEHHELRLTAPMVINMIPQVGQYMDEPIADSSFVPTMLLSQFTRETVTVALGGDGGDEVFAGYSTLQAHRIMSIYKSMLPNPIRRMVQFGVGLLPVSFNNISLDFKLRRFSNYDRFPFELRHHYWLGSFDTDMKRHVLLKNYQREQASTFGIVQHHLEQCGASDLLNRVLYLDMKMYLDGDILPKVDRASMAHSLEVRVPFLNHEILKFISRLPIQYKLDGLTTKAVLRKAMQPYLPPQIVRRSKKGFNMPVAKWLTEDLREWASDLLSAERIKRQGIFHAAEVQKLLNDHLTRKRDARKQLWTLLMFQVWLDHWLES